MADHSQEEQLSPEQELVVKLLVEQMEEFLQGIRDDIQAMRQELSTGFQGVREEVQRVGEEVQGLTRDVSNLAQAVSNLGEEFTGGVASCRRSIARIDHALLQLSLPPSWRNPRPRYYAEPRPSRGPFAQ